MSAFPILPPAEAIAFFRKKGLAASFAWQDVWQAEHARAFTVAKAMTRGVLESIREELDTALAEGLTLEQFRIALRPRLEAQARPARLAASAEGDLQHQYAHRLFGRAV